MSVKQWEIQAQSRSTGKGPSRRLRRQQWIPVIVYGKGINRPLAIRRGDAQKIRAQASDSVIYQIRVDGDVLPALLRQVQVDPVTRQVEHLDFQAIDLTQPIRIQLELRFEGKPVGLAEGGLLTIVNRSVEIECLPTQIPDPVVVDISQLGVGDAIHVSDVQFPEGVRVITSGQTTLAVVNLPRESSSSSDSGTPTEANPAGAEKSASTSAKKT